MASDSEEGAPDGNDSSELGSEYEFVAPKQRRQPRKQPQGPCTGRDAQGRKRCWRQAEGLPGGALRPGIQRFKF